ncbi:cell division protein FtsZ [Candidatus Uhrbacteria bacterium]|nr:cell division protein FtsZ [Candidatus Uhrbacteria bacterium]
MGEVKPDIETFAKIKVVGIGGGGGAALNRMIRDEIKGVQFIAVNTDVQALNQNLAMQKIAIGKTLTRGLGAGMNPEVGKRAAEENQNELREALTGADMVFLTCGLGGGTGSGGGPEVAKIAKDLGALTVAVVTKPFGFEGAQRRRIADEAYERLSQYVDAIITIPNDRVLQIIDKKTSLLDAFRVVDDVLRQGVQGISELITIPGLINVDFADVKAIMENSGSALMGIGKASGENRAVDAAKQAVASPLLELSIDGAKGILFTITGGEDMGMHEVAEAAKVITGSADEDAKVIFGANVDPNLKDEIRISVVATGFDSRERRRVTPDAVEVPSQGVWTPGNLLRPREPERRSPSASPPSPPPSIPPYQPKQMPVRMKPNEYRIDPPPMRAPEPPRPKPLPPMDRPNAPRSPMSNPPAHSEEEDMEIPAFIRKKMM